MDTNVYSQNQTSKSTPNKLSASKNAGSASSSTKHANKKLSDLTPEEREELEKQRAEVETTLQCPAQFIVSLALDRDVSKKPNEFNYTGGVWVGTEDSGVYYYQVGADGKETWTQYTITDGLADNYAYAITCDYLGRVWVGHLNHGVSVFNGEKWQNYDVVAGPLGAHVFAMTASPVDGDVWIATDAGLSRYSISKNTWSYYTRADGLPSDQIQTLAFDKKGTLFVGTQCEGLAISTPLGDYKIWRTVSGPDKIPTSPSGRGLPSNSINCITILPNGNVCVGTTTGLAFSRDSGSSWNYIRGKDYAAKVKGLWGGPPKKWEPPTPEKQTDLLLEDYITGIAADQNGYVWVTYRQKGYEVIDPITNAKYRSMEDERMTLADGYISTLLPLPDKPPLIARYGGKLVQFAKKMPSRKRETYVSKFGLAKASQANAASSNSTEFPSLPTDAAPPTTEDFLAMRAKLQNNMAKVGYPYAMYLGDDWVTQGDWVGRYGRQYAILCAANAPVDHVLSYGNKYYLVDAQNGPHQAKGDAIRRWVHWLESNDPRVLYDPVIGVRRQAEWDDHGETYPMYREGPDLWIEVIVPTGVHRLSMYFFNKDGHNSQNRFRDYEIELRPLANTFAEAEAIRPLASARVRDFWGGVHKRFVVAGPGKYLVKVDRNYSFNTIISSVMLDRLAGPSNEYDKLPLSRMGGKSYDPPVLDDAYKNSTHPVHMLWNQLEASWDKKVSLFLQQEYRAYIYRLSSQDALFASTVRWRSHIWTADDRSEFQQAMKAGWDAFTALNPGWAESIHTPRKELVVKDTKK